MSLASDICRCLGEKPAGFCEARSSCLRFIERDSYGQRTPFARWMCGPSDTDYMIPSCPPCNGDCNQGRLCPARRA